VAVLAEATVNVLVALLLATEGFQVIFRTVHEVFSKVGSGEKVE